MKMVNDMEPEMAAGGAQNNGEILCEGITNAVEKNKPVIDVIADGSGTVWNVLEHLYNR